MSGKRTLEVEVVGNSQSGQKAFDDLDKKGQGTGKSIGGTFSSLLTTLGSSTSGFLGPLSEVFSLAGEHVEKLTGEHVKFTTAMGVTGAAATGLGALLMGLGSEEVRTQAQLKQAIDNSGHSYEDYESKIEKVIGQQENFGHSANETRTALQALTQATGDPQKAIDSLGNVADLAAAKHESLSKATTQYIQILEGKGNKVLQQFGLSTTNVKEAANKLEVAQKNVTKATNDLHDAQQRLSDLEAVDAEKKKLTVADEQHLRDARNNVQTATVALSTAQAQLTDAQNTASQATQQQSQVTQELADKTGGQAKQAVAGFRGEMEVLKTKVEDAVGAFGKDFGPTLTVTGTIIQTTASAIEVGAAILGRFRNATAAATVATEAQTVAQGELDVAMTEGAVAEGFALAPVLIITAAVIALGVGIYELATHWNTVMTFLGNAASAAWSNIYNYFVHPIESWVVNFASTAARSFGQIGEIIFAPFKGAFNLIAWAWNHTVAGLDFTIPSWVPVLGGDHFSVPKMATVLDTGGIVMGPTLAALSMNSVPEAVIPLPQLPQLAATIAGQNGGNNNGVNVVFQPGAIQSNADAGEIADEMAWAIKTMARTA